MATFFPFRSFAHILDDGGGRRTTLRGRTNILKRYRIQAMGYNLSLLMRALIGVGTPKQAMAQAISVIATGVFDLIGMFVAIWRAPQRRCLLPCS